jgi:C1A family cysteine protease
MIERSNRFLKWVPFWVLFCLVLCYANLSVAAEIDEIRRAITSRGAKWVAQENPISLLSKSERKMRLGAVRESAPAEEMVNDFSLAPGPVPSAFDWRNVLGNNFVTPVRNQGNCGSCWAFAVTAALESRALITFNLPGTNLNLSEQIVLSCSGGGSCNGGSPTTATNFFKTTGVNLETCYPYVAQNGSCSTACANWQNSVYKITDWSYVSTGATAIKNAVYTNGPIVTVFDVYTDFFSYRSGIYSYTSGQYEGGHAVLIVGWSDADGAFIVKNSWGASWGESGFFRIAYSELTGTTKFGQFSLAYGTALDLIRPQPPAGLRISTSN